MSNPFANWKIADAELHNARVEMKTAKQHNVALVGEAYSTVRTPVKIERDLHARIFDECRRRGWIALHGSMSERSHRTLGEWDFTVVADNGRVFFIEVKTASGKLRAEQQGLIAWAHRLGHVVHIIRSMEEFLKIIWPHQPHNPPHRIQAGVGSVIHMQAG